MKYIKLEKSDLTAIVDEEDFDRVVTHKWYLHAQGYAHSFSLFTEQTKLITGSVLLHRFVLNNPQGVVHHKDNNKLNNCKSNLLITSQQQNVALASKTKHKNYFCRYKGLRWNVTSLKWDACVCVNYNKFNLGVYNSSHEAAYAYNFALSKLKSEGTFYKNVLSAELTDEQKQVVEQKVLAKLAKKGAVIL